MSITAQQRSSVARVLEMVEKVADEWGDASCLDVLEGVESDEASRVEEHLSIARASLRSLKKRLDERLRREGGSSKLEDVLATLPSDDEEDARDRASAKKGG